MPKDTNRKPKRSGLKVQEALNARLKQARESLGETQEQFTKRLGLPIGTLRNWEQGTRTPRGLALEALNAKLDAILKA